MHDDSQFEGDSGWLLDERLTEEEVRRVKARLRVRRRPTRWIWLAAAAVVVLVLLFFPRTDPVIEPDRLLIEIVRTDLSEARPYRIEIEMKRGVER